nr:hypothetical protein [Arthrobacter sp. KBS0703]
MTGAQASFKNPDCSLASRDDALPGLPYLLDSSRLSSLLGETVRVTRVRYKPRTSLLVAFRRIRNGAFDYGWAMTRTRAGNAKLLRRELTSRSRGGDIRVLRPDPRQDDNLVAVGGVEDDWVLYGNLLWLREHGMERLGLPQQPGSVLAGTGSVLRYKPERRLVLFVQNSGAPVVIKAAATPAGRRAAGPFPGAAEPARGSAPPPTGDAECLEHGISACAAWGGGDLAGLDDDSGAVSAGEALARLHGIPPRRFPGGAGRLAGRHRRAAAGNAVHGCVPAPRTGGTGPAGRSRAARPAAEGRRRVRVRPGARRLLRGPGAGGRFGGATHRF